MAATQVQKSAQLSNNTGAALTWTVGTNPTNSNLFVVTTGQATGTAPGTGAVADNKGNTYSRAVAANTTGDYADIYYFLIPSAANYTSYTVTFTPGASAAEADMSGAEYSTPNGWLTSGVAGVTTSNVGTSAAGSTGTTATTSVDCVLAVGCLTDASGGNPATLTNSSSNWNNTNKQNNGVSFEVCIDDYRTVSVASTTLSDTWTIDNVHWNAAIATFIANPPAGGTVAPPPMRTLRGAGI